MGVEIINTSLKIFLSKTTRDPLSIHFTSTIYFRPEIHTLLSFYFNYTAVRFCKYVLHHNNAIQVTTNWPHTHIQIHHQQEEVKILVINVNKI